MKTKRTWTACIALSLSVLCGSVPVYATESAQESIAQQDVQIQAPAQVQAAALETGGVQLTWDAVPDASGYRIYRRNQDAWELLHIVKKAEKIQLHRQNNGHADGIHVYASRVYTDKRDDKTGSCQPRSDSDNGRCTWNTGYAGSNIQRSKQSDDFLECRGRRNRL